MEKNINLKPELKEKVVLLYEKILFTDEDFTVANPYFWDEFFLLWPNCQCLENEIDGWTANDLSRLKTLLSLIRGITRKSAQGIVGYDIIDILIGYDKAEIIMQVLIERLSNVLIGGSDEFPICLKTAVLEFILLIVTCVPDITQNALLEYFLITSVFEALVQLLSHSVTRKLFGWKSLILLTILVNYRKYESVNPYIVKLSILDDELALNGYSHLISATLTDFNSLNLYLLTDGMNIKESKIVKLHSNLYRDMQLQLQESEPRGLLSSVTSLVSNMFVPSDLSQMQVHIRTDECILLAMYEAVHLNRNFITTFSNLPADDSAVASTSSYSSTIPNNHAKQLITSTDDAAAGKCDSHENSSKISNLPIASTGPDLEYPNNLLVSFLTHCSVLMQDVKNEKNQVASRLCMIILLCITEDQYANSLMHDVNMTFRVPLYRAPMRHRRIGFDQSHTVPSRPLACAVLDLCREFVLSHMMRNLPYDLYILSLAVMHRILCHEKKCRIRLQYPWRDLWNDLQALLKYLVSNVDYIMPKFDIFVLTQKVINIFNLFITFGDTFLPNPSSYDELYYELIRGAETFNNLYTCALKYVACEDESHRLTAAKLCNNLINIRSIIQHFRLKLETCSNSCVTEHEVLEVVRSNYESLTLKLQENLDVFERYNENPHESEFFLKLVRQIVIDTRTKLKLTEFDQRAILKQLNEFNT